jgi:dihydroorotate dehydrogenase (NAD+) catalytic subunit
MLANVKHALSSFSGRSGRSLRSSIGKRLPKGSVVDMRADIGVVQLRNPILTAAGTAGHGAELAGFFKLDALGGVVVKSLSAQPWQGNPAPRVTEVSAGMMNSVGLQNAGVDHWIEFDLPALRKANATIVASIWGFTIDAYEEAAAKLRGIDDIVAVEVNVSCPNIEDRRHMFAHSTEGTMNVLRATRKGLGPNTPMWAKLSPNVTALSDIAAAAIEAGADALTLINTVMGMRIDTETRRPALGAGGGGISGPAIRPVAIRAVYETRKAFPHIPIIGAGGVAHGVDAVEFFLAGANAVEVGTATFYEPGASKRIAEELATWCEVHNVNAVSELIGAAHG